MLKLTGFPLPDVGVLTLTAMANKTDPATVTLDDLDAAAKEVQDFYATVIGKSLASTTFPNSGFFQPAFDKPEGQYKRRAWADLVLRGHRDALLEPSIASLEKKEYREMVLRGVEGAPPDAFTGEPAYLRVSRDMLPMLNGRGIGNFSAQGEAGLPVSATTLLAIHAMPLGCLVTQGALLAVESDNRDLMFEFVRGNLEQNRRFVSLAATNGYDKYPNVSSYRTRLISALVESFKRSEASRNEFNAPSLNAYHFSNYGANARISIYPMPSSTVSFIRTAGSGIYVAHWERILSRGWTQEKDEAEELAQKAPKLTRRNLIYEDIFELPENAHQFLRTYFLRAPLRKFKGDPREGQSPFTEADLISWDLTSLFLGRIMGMQQSRIDQIRSLGDRLADHIQEQNDRRLLQSLYYERQYWRFRAAILRAMYGYSGDEPLVTFDSYVQIFTPFEEGAGVERADWNLSRDLLLIRIFEKLHAGGYWSVVTETLQQGDEDDVLKPVTD